MKRKQFGVKLTTGIVYAQSSNNTEPNYAFVGNKLRFSEEKCICDGTIIDGWGTHALQAVFVKKNTRK